MVEFFVAIFEIESETLNLKVMAFFCSSIFFSKKSFSELNSEQKAGGRMKIFE